MFINFMSKISGIYFHLILFRQIIKISTLFVFLEKHAEIFKKIK